MEEEFKENDDLEEKVLNYMLYRRLFKKY